jgi:hypothetical protein
VRHVDTATATVDGSGRSSLPGEVVVVDGRSVVVYVAG